MNVVGTEVTVSSRQALVMKLLMQFISNTISITTVQTGLSTILDINIVMVGVIVTRAVSKPIFMVHSVAPVDLLTKDITVSVTEALHKTVPDSTNVIVIVNSTLHIIRIVLILYSSVVISEYVTQICMGIVV